MPNKARKNKLFYVILVIFPVILLILLEIVLRLFSFGHHYPLFIEADAIAGYLQPNPNVIKRFFSNPNLAPEISPDTFYFKKVKPFDSFRIVIQGGSTAAGFPFGRFGSLQGMLQQRFKRIYPNKEIEIISTAMSAVNSYALLDFSDEIIEIEPDLILVYAGHNEYLGIMGVGSAYAAKSNRSTSLLFLKLKEMKLFQLMQNFIGLFQANNKIRANDKVDKRNLMAMVAKNKSIVLNSQIYQDGLEQFSSNLDLILEKYKEHNIPILISTLASNEVDQPPFSSSKGKFSADGYFEKGKNLLLQKKYKQATRAFTEASDRDLLRFRAPSQFNSIILSKIDNANIHLVDVQKRIRSEAKDGVIGFQHMFEHLHPNARGYFILSEAFLDTILTKKLIDDSPETYPSELAWKDIPITKVDRIAASFKIKTLVSDYPFTAKKKVVTFGEARTAEEKFALKKLQGTDWLLLHQEMLQHYQTTEHALTEQNRLSQLHEAAKIAGLIFDAFPNQHRAAWVAGKIHFSINDTKIAEYYLKRSIDLQPENIEYLMNYAYSLYVNHKKRESVSILERVLAIQPDHPQALMQKQRISQGL